MLVLLFFMVLAGAGRPRRRQSQGTGLVPAGAAGTFSACGRPAVRAIGQLADLAGSVHRELGRC